ncbi:histidine kinase dimerization/phosphoacceptor domain -containing protein [Arenibacter sp. GZD96]|uniref:histidine kinase dimerization/phosphoacceptor domain -containing protein n=1 Tax=Aurantibrevibacter litoralis TaxID=3106030 RepID=UPI002B00022B|nr:histidine kinase dimerization/phosphoacceptor domain -containing protein [Arenibacter sp. GZD-96]MEA1786269.1 histidine kinase dimerization/phosphoacceptor domain -containing protein [Arenibacter sp. GZD-96]
MKRVLHQVVQYGFLILSTLSFTLAQDSLSYEQLIQEYRISQSAEERFSLFFNTPNRYSENSAYDWLDATTEYRNQAQKKGAVLETQYYKLIQSQIYYDLGDYDKSIAIANELYKEGKQLELEFKKRLLDLMDNAYAQLQLFDKELEIRREKKELGFTENIAFYDIYSQLGLHRKAMEDYIMEMKKTVKEDDYYSLAKYHNTIGNYLRLDKSTSVALTKFKEAKGYIDVYLNNLAIVKTELDINNSHLLRGIIEGNIGRCYVALRQFDEAIPYLEQGSAAIKEYNTGVFSSELIDYQLDLAECYLQLENYEMAQSYLSENSKPVKIQNVLRKNRLLATYFDKTEDYQNATVYLKRNALIRDSLSNNDTAIKKQQLAAVFGQDLANTRTMIDEQKEALERSRNEMQAKDERINFVFISLVFTLLGFAGMFYAYLRSIKTQRLIAEQKHIIENSLVEKDSLLKEIHHRVKNNLQMVSSLLSLQTKNTKSKAAIEALEEGKSRVKAMALIHQKLYQNDDLSVIEMQSYIESLINSIQSVYKKGGHNINITIDAEGVELDIDRAIPFGLVLNELVSNSFKYAFPEGDENGKIYIHIRKNGEQGFFEYTDNGIGLPADTDDRANASMGIRLMNRLVNQLQSNLNIDKTAEGVRFWFNFK